MDQDNNSEVCHALTTQFSVENREMFVIDAFVTAHTGVKWHAGVVWEHAQKTKLACFSSIAVLIHPEQVA